MSLHAFTLNPVTEYICSKDPEELIRLFYQSLVQRSALIRGDVEERYMPPDLEGLPKEQQPYQPMVFTSASGRFQLDTTYLFLVPFYSVQCGNYFIDISRRTSHLKLCVVLNHYIRTTICPSDIVHGWEIVIDQTVPL